MKISKITTGTNVFNIVLKDSSNKTQIVNFSALSKRMAKFEIPIKSSDPELNLISIYE